MAETKPANGCQRCAKLEARVAALEARLARSERHSGNSSKPPSSDVVKPPRKHWKPGRPKRRKIGGQPGHARHLRTRFSPEELDRHWVWKYDECPCCGGRLVDSDQPPRVLQQIELLETPVQVEQHDSQPQWCARCEKTFVPRLVSDSLETP